MKRVAFLLGVLCAAAWSAPDPAAPQDSLPADSLPAFKPDSSKSSAIKAIESGSSGRPARAQSTSSIDSLEKKLRRRHPFVGVTLGIAFNDLSAKRLFTAQLDSAVLRDSLRVLQPYDPVHVYFPVGLVAAIPVFTYLDVWLRSEHFWYQMSALAQGDGPAREFQYAVDGQLFGIGARFLIPVSQLSVNGHSGLYLAYTRFWNFPPSELYSQTGSVRAKTEPGGLGYEVQAGFQQDFDRRWTLTGGLAFADFGFKSRSSWRAILPEGPDEPAHWNLKSLRLAVQGIYQFGIQQGKSENQGKGQK